MRLPGGPHLTYCGNVHPARTLAEVEAGLVAHGSALKRRLSPDAPFGLGLRFSAAASRELIEGDRLARLRARLDAMGMYAVTLNAFPYGTFHGQPVKAGVFAPDWREEARVAYTLQSATILAALLPADHSGGLSTVPLSYKAWVDAGDTAAWLTMTDHLVRVAEALVRRRKAGGPLVHVDLEPEPDGLLATTAEVATYFERWLLPVGGARLAMGLGTSVAEARGLLLDHVRICLDACHMAVSDEDPVRALRRLADVGVKIGKVQLSSALRVTIPPGAEARSAIARRLAPFAESTYLHQVAERLPDGRVRHYPDLAEALPHLAATPGVAWRIHFHVPIFLASAGPFGTTQGALRRLLEVLARQPGPCPPLEIETYTWGVLPAEWRLELTDALEREYRWAIGAWAAAAPDRAKAG